jgi:hypothetical protein
MISGQATFGSTGAKSLYFGTPINEVVFGCGTSVGYADANHQFCRYDPTSYDETKSMVFYNGATKVLEFTVTGGWNTSTLTFNVTYASASYPFKVGAR